MKFLMWLLGLFSLAVALKLAAHNPGYLLLVYPPYRIEISLTLFLLMLLTLFVLGYFAVRLALSAIRLPAYVRQFRIERAHSKGRSAMMEALVAFFEGRYAVAEKAAVDAMELGESSSLNPVIAARAAHELREFERRDAYLATADNKSAGVSTMRLMAQAKFNLDQHQPQAALQSLKELRESGVKGHVGALHLELRAQQQARNWDAILDVVDQLEKRNAMDDAAATQIRQQAWLEKIRTHTLDAPALLAIWKSTPGEFKRRPKVVAAAARAFIHQGDCRNARQIITDRLNAAWDSDLVMLYGECLTGEAGSHIEQAERWLKQYPDDAGLLLVLGKLCLHQGLWSKAQNYLDASNSIAPSSAAYTTLGQLSEKLQRPDEAFKYFQKAMALVQPGK
ncbi:MAG: heme biosynthesis HemY N-terminal domain-containing protein [Candidatus Nitrotoga sp.]|nr:heme biosynthesis HemY N-terminal domain-containing protein [Candidatus Nitrotoga sp.]MDO9446770.1 heme biosynthesis HemY N-terminal domain-containing protein [Candidatus Nitrotoga sp.]MDP3497002.1 heme biosynthesis HemY N-terminal domain-containing protein [Candidatus Nitrotoga sp.]